MLTFLPGLHIKLPAFQSSFLQACLPVYLPYKPACLPACLHSILPVYHIRAYQPASLLAYQLPPYQPACLFIYLFNNI
jgi:hypothetical protein